MQNYKRYLKSLLLYPEMERISSRHVTPIWNLRRLGSSYGGWTVPANLLSERSVCYCVGAGEDITFDLELIKRFGCEIFSYDPTPRAAAHVVLAIKNADRYHFFPIGIWDQNETLKFYAPADPSHVSHSVLNLQGTNAYFEAECKSLSTVFAENGHVAADLLKLDVEGAEYRILKSIVREKLQISIICVEFDELHHPLDDNAEERVATAIRELLDFGYELICVEACNYTFLKKTNFPYLARAIHSVWALCRRS